MSDQLRSDRRSLARAFPLAFVPQGAKLPKLPLKIGITADILALGVTGEDGEPMTEDRIRAAVADYCCGPKYQRVAAAGGQRIDLSGQPAGEVAEGERNYHAAVLRKLTRASQKQGRKAKANTPAASVAPATLAA